MGVGTASTTPDRGGTTGGGWYCLFCDRIVAPAKAPPPPECPTPGCRRTTGFGVHADTPRRPR